MFRRLFKKKFDQGGEIDPEEIFMDSLNTPRYERVLHEGRIERPIERRVFLIWGVFAVLGLFVLGIRLFQLQYIRGDEYLAASNENIWLNIFTASPRGLIFDRKMEVIADNTAIFSLVLKKIELPKLENFEKALSTAAGLFGKTREDLWFENDLGDHLAEIPYDLFSPEVWPDEIVIEKNISREIILKVATEPANFPGLVIEESIHRIYPDRPEAFSHVLGFVGQPTKDDQKSSTFYRRASRIIGKSGMELVYEEELRGRPGRKVIEIDSKGMPQRERFIEEPEPGMNLQLTIDAGLQKAVYEIMGRHLAVYGKKAGAVVVSDPRDGQILALVSYPGFNSKMLSDGMDREGIRAILNSKTTPMVNRSISGIYAPGSTVKPILAVAALEEGIIDPGHQIYDEGFISVPNPYDPEKVTIYKDWTKLGWVDMRRALAWSANVYFYTIGGGYQDIKGLGIERIRKFLNIFGFGRVLGIELPGEKAGLVPGPEEKKRIRPKDPFWRLGDTYITSIGQGDTIATPLQVNFATAALANGGTLWKPFVTKEIRDLSGMTLRQIRPVVIHDRIANPESISVSRQGMRLAVTQGSAKTLADFPVYIAGKTGTAQTGLVGKNHGWFTGFAPYDNPEVVVTVLVEEGTGGTTDAVPIAKEVFYAWFVGRDRQHTE